MAGNDNLIALSPHPLVVDETPVMYRAGQIRSLFSTLADRDAQIERMRSELDRLATPAPPPDPATAEVVAWQWEVFEGGCWETCHAPVRPDLEHWSGTPRNLRPLYATPPAAPAAARSAAEEMRERCARIVEKAFSPNRVSLAGAIRALPLPGDVEESPAAKLAREMREGTARFRNANGTITGEEA